MEKRKKLILPVLVLLLAAAVYAGITYMKTINAAGEEDNIYYGTVEAEQMDIGAEVSGRLKEINVEEGQNIKAGDLLAVIDAPENRIKVEQSELSLGNAENELLRTEEGNREQEINIQRAQVKQCEAALKQAEAVMEQTKALAAQSEVNHKSAQETYTLRKQDYEDIKALYANGAASLQEHDNAEYAMNTALHAMENAAHSLQSANAQLSGSNAQVESAKFQLEAAKEKLDLLVAGATERSLAASRYGVGQAEKGLSLSKLALDKGNVVSLKDGTVETINFSTGEFVGVGSPLITLIDRSDLWVKVYVPEKALPGLKIGKQVSIRCDYLKDKTIKGEVTYIAPEAEFTPLNIVTKEDRMKLVYAVKVKILDNLDSIKPGMLLDVDLR